MKKIIGIIAVTTLIFAGCNQSKQETNNGFDAVDTLVKQTSFQKEIDGKKVDLFTLKNDSGIVAKFTNYGARLVSLLVPDKNGVYADVVLGYSSIEDYLKDRIFSGCVVGRFANRIGDAKFKLDGKEYNLTANNNGNSLHGGKKGFDQVVWDAVHNGDTLSLSYVSQDMEEGYPGTLTVKINYILTNNNEIVMEYEATTDKSTVLNITNHASYNLQGEGSPSILGHILEINAKQTTVIDKELIPTGKLADVAGTALDFNTPTAIGDRINSEEEQMKFGGGYDHNWVLNKKELELALAIKLTDTISGRVLELFTTEPGIQVYTANFMDGSVIGKAGKPYNYRCAIAMEPQHFPDSPNRPEFPSVVLKPGQTYTQTSILKFSIKK